MCYTLINAATIVLTIKKTICNLIKLWYFSITYCGKIDSSKFGFYRNDDATTFWVEFEGNLQAFENQKYKLQINSKLRKQFIIHRWLTISWSIASRLPNIIKDSYIKMQKKTNGTNSIFIHFVMKLTNAFELGSKRMKFNSTVISQFWIISPITDRLIGFI